MPPKAKNEKMTYEEMVARLEEIVALLESGDLSLEESVRIYREALTLSEKCSALLDRFQGEITVVRDGKEVPAGDDDDV